MMLLMKYFLIQLKKQNNLLIRNIQMLGMLWLEKKIGMMKHLVILELLDLSWKEKMVNGSIHKLTGKKNIADAIKISFASWIFSSKSSINFSTFLFASIANVGNIIVTGQMFPLPSFVWGFTPGSAFISYPLAVLQPQVCL